MSDGAELLRRVGATVFERGWLSSNNILFARGPSGAAVVDTGYVAHAEQTTALLANALNGDRLRRVVNTHLHSDHCGGNAALQSMWDCRTEVPAVSVPAVASWRNDRLSYRYTDQRCPRFDVHAGLLPGECIELGGLEWQVLAAGGHDPDAVMLFQADQGVLIAGDALWESRVAIIFPELVGGTGFGPATATLALIEALHPKLVVPGHGAPFTQVASALKSARSRLLAFEERPAAHHRYAAKALVMFHMLEIRSCAAMELQEWLRATPVFSDIWQRTGTANWSLREFAKAIVDGLIAGGQLESSGTVLAVR